MSNQFSKHIEYRPVPDFPFYRVGNDGSVWGNRRRNGGEPLWVKLRPYKHRKGYLQVDLRGGVYHRQKTMSVHHMILLSFGFERPSSSHETRHLNGIPDDNRLCNLKWGTGKENSEDKCLHGKKLYGENCKNHKLTDDDVRKIRGELSGLPIPVLAEMFKVNYKTMYCVVLMMTWKHVRP